MKKITAIIAASAAAAMLSIVPTVTANASTVAAKAAHDYTLHVTAKGGASIEYITVVKSSSGDGAKVKTVHTGATHWHHAASGKAQLVELIAHQRHGSTVSCSITDHSGHVLSTSTGHGAHAVATCVVTTQDLVNPGS